MASKKKVKLPTCEQFEQVLETLSTYVLGGDEDFSSDGYAYTPDGVYVSQEESDTHVAVINYLESLHPVVYKTRRVREPAGRVGLK